MAGWGKFHDFKPKQCVVCGADYVPKSGVQKFCTEKCKGKWKYIAGTCTTDTQYAGISGNWRRYYARLLNHHGKHGFSIRKTKGLSIDVIMNLHEAQNGRCALSGVPMTCILKRGVRAWSNASIDRANHEGTYALDNIQLVCAGINGFKHQLKQFDFVWWCCQVAKHSGFTMPSGYSAALVEGTGGDDHVEIA